MALTPEIDGVKAAALTVGVAGEASILVTKSVLLVPYRIPTVAIEAVWARSLPLIAGNHEIDVTQATALVVCRGLVAHPRILVWTFTLDGHDFLVVGLQDQTLVHDFLSNKWYTWGTGPDDGGWRAVLGQNWNANLGTIMKALGGQNQSNVICGDEINGALYFLDPELAEDDDSEGTPGLQFSRIFTGQLSLRGHDYVACDAVELTGSTGEAPEGLADNSVTLSISDDKGHSYWSAGAHNVASGIFDETLSWRSLGSFTGPGRLFRVTDYGALARIDGLDIPDGA